MHLPIRQTVLSKKNGLNKKFKHKSKGSEIKLKKLNRKD